MKKLLCLIVLIMISKYVISNEDNPANRKIGSSAVKIGYFVTALSIFERLSEFRVRFNTNFILHGIDCDLKKSIDDENALALKPGKIVKGNNFIMRDAQYKVANSFCDYEHLENISKYTNKGHNLVSAVARYSLKGFSLRPLLVGPALIAIGNLILHSNERNN